MSTHTTTNPTTETPSSSETGGSNSMYPKESTSAADVSTSESKVGMTSNQASSTTSNQPGSAEAAAEKLYEERIEEEYAKLGRWYAVGISSDVMWLDARPRWYDRGGGLARPLLLHQAALLIPEVY
ncbi:hypothetical protein LTR97_009589 [Elasticomyces elasticus]|uniref:Uncharacterized protein n=1 Tax=Elasticomyces elasticus TaxID=574655 RepID=A0AAN7ZX01_9PEZI|nr:hypothetical protein LTR97_009589 [Elasticomyces elasticus]KAK5722379.1 hypothetical protein LTR15_005609 [Elasticomyces elasticus]